MLAYPPLISRLLARRGVRTAAQAQSFFGVAEESLPNPFDLPDMGLAVERLKEAMEAGETVAIYGDFDVDGITATAILLDGLRALGLSVCSFIPNRFRDGYGVSREPLLRLAGQGVRLVITVDCGISAVAEIAAAGESGIDMIVLDHHEVGDRLPAAVAVIDPKRADSQYPTRDICSGALALRLLQALYAALDRELPLDQYQDLAALATVCDMVPLVGENRALVKAGLRSMARVLRPGLQALLQAGNGEVERPDTETLGFRLGPRINAAGRLDDASLALELLTTPEIGRATELAERLSELNSRRQQMVEEALLLAHELTAQEAPSAAAIVIGHAQISRGIVGLIASRLAETYRRPAFVYEVGGDGCVGSARGVPGFDVVQALGEAKHLLIRHGGHRAAGGFAFNPSNLESFTLAIQAAAERQTAALGIDDELEVDADPPLSAINRPVVGFLQRFAPCGTGNPAPLLMSRGVSVLKCRTVGSGKHLLFDLRDGPVVWRGFAFNRGEDLASVGTRMDLVYSVEKGSRGFGPRLRLFDWKASTGMGAVS